MSFTIYGLLFWKTFNTARIYTIWLLIGWTSRLWNKVLARPNRPKYGYWPDRTYRNMGIGPTEQTKIWVLARPNRPNLGIGQTKQAEIWVFARPNRPKYGYWPDQTDRNMGIGQTEQTEIWVFARPNRLKLPLARRKARPKFFPDHCGWSHRTPLSATHVDLANTCLGSRTSSWDNLKRIFIILLNFNTYYW